MPDANSKSGYQSAYPRSLITIFVVCWTLRTSSVICTFSGPVGFNILFGNRVELNPGLGGVRDVASAIISHEQTQ